jgi:peptide/nickel transport system permease protein
MTNPSSDSLYQTAGGGSQAGAVSRLHSWAGACKRHPWRTLCGLVVLAAVFVALAAPHLMPLDPFEQDLLARNTPPSDAYRLGADHLGRDILSRLILGARLSLGVGLASMLIALFLGGGLGLLAAAVGGWFQYLFFAFVDLIRAMPGVLFALVLLVSLGSGLTPVILALGITFSPHFARIALATYQRENSMDYVAAARQFGSTRLKILLRHILPNVLGAFITQAAIILPRCMVTESVLSFLGLGVPPDTPTWGRMIAQAGRFVELTPTSVLFPVLALSALTLSLAILSDGLRVYFDPLRRGGKEKS